VTVTVTVAVVVPPGPVAVSVYRVVCGGLTLSVLLAGRLPPAPGVTVTLLTFVVLQLNSVASPAARFSGVAIKLLIVGGGVTVTVVEAVAVPSGPVAVSV
jgi:hypothetical protein